MLVAPLFNFILASVDDSEAGSASGVLNAVQQLAGAAGVAVIGTIFFSELGHAGFVSALDRCLIVELCLVPVLILLTLLLPQHPRNESELIVPPLRGRDSCGLTAAVARPPGACSGEPAGDAAARRRLGDRVHGLVERLSIHLAGGAHAGHLADVLQRGGVHLLVAGVIGLDVGRAKGLDASAHAPNLRLELLGN